MPKVMKNIKNLRKKFCEFRPCIWMHTHICTLGFKGYNPWHTVYIVKDTKTVHMYLDL